jgi:hypothetical protein
MGDGVGGGEAKVTLIDDHIIMKKATAKGFSASRKYQRFMVYIKSSLLFLSIFILGIVIRISNY